MTAGPVPLTLSPLTAPDADCVAGWVHSQAEVTLFAGPGLVHPLTGEALLAEASERWEVFGLRRDGVLVATGSVGSRGEGVARIGRVLVDPARRGQGLGRAAMLALLERASAWPRVASVTLGVYAHNAVAIALYESLGFVDTGKRTTTDVEGVTWVARQYEKRLRTDRPA